jgi:hypothetical protein
MPQSCFKFRASSEALFLCIIKSMDNKKVKFAFNQTAHYKGKRYQSGNLVEMPVKDANKLINLNFGNVDKPKASKKNKEKT